MSLIITIMEVVVGGHRASSGKCSPFGTVNEATSFFWDFAPIMSSQKLHKNSVVIARERGLGRGEREYKENQWSWKKYSKN